MESLGTEGQKDKDLRKKMRKLKIYFKDIKETFIRSPKSGGQNVNKVSTCVQLTHVPTGIQVKCFQERSQAQNRQKARHLLVKKIEERVHQQKLKAAQEVEKQKRRNRKRPGYLKESILQEKHKRSEKKQMRKKINPKAAD